MEESAQEMAERKARLVDHIRKEHEHRVKLGLLVVNLGIAPMEEIFPRGLKHVPELLPARPRLQGAPPPQPTAQQQQSPPPIVEAKIIENVPTTQEPCPLVQQIPAPSHPATNALRKKLNVMEGEIQQRLRNLAASRDKYLNADRVHIPCLEEEQAVLQCYQRVRISGSHDVVPCYDIVQAFKKCAERMNVAFAGHFGKAE